MTSSADLLIDGFGRIRENVLDVLSGLTPAQLAHQVAPGRQPDQLAPLAPDAGAGRPRGGGLRRRAGMVVWGLGGAVRAAAGELDGTGYGHTSSQVAAVGPPSRRRGCLRIPRGDARADGEARFRGDRRRPGPGRRRALDAAGHAGRAPGIGARRRHAACGAGRVRAGKSAWLDPRWAKLRFSSSEAILLSVSTKDPRASKS